TIMIQLLANTPDISNFMMCVLYAIQAVLILLFAPSKIENQTNIPKKYYKLLKFVSLVIVSANLLIESPVLATTFTLQSILLISIQKRNELKGGETIEN